MCKINKVSHLESSIYTAINRRYIRIINKQLKHDQSLTKAKVKHFESQAYEKEIFLSCVKLKPIQDDSG